MKIEPFIPYYSKLPNKVVREWTEEFDDGWGHKATVHKVSYVDGKKSSEKEAVRMVVWKNDSNN